MDNESIVITGNTIGEGFEFGVVNADTNRILTYDGETDVGAVLVIEAKIGIGSFTVTNMTNGSYMTLSNDLYEEIVGHQIQNGDIIVIDTRRGRKQALANSMDTDYNILNSVISTSSWFYISPGVNEIRMETEASTMEYEFYIQYEELYKGL